MTLFLVYDTDNAATRSARMALEDWAARRSFSFSARCAHDGKAAHCIGCFGCWVKTPGHCILPPDAATEAQASFAQADVTLFLMEPVFGGYHPEVKALMDRMIPALHPYFRKFNGEYHHLMRYPLQRRLFHVPYGSYDTNELATFAGLHQAHCDNLRCPPARRLFEYRSDAGALATWLEEELA